MHYLVTPHIVVCFPKLLAVLFIGFSFSRVELNTVWDRMGTVWALMGPYGHLLNRMGIVWIWSHKCPYGSIRAHTVPIRSDTVP